ncbi:hypothetical protein [Candidatus Pelagibacter sp. Uisw_127]|uniref:hypothetical protein n=1 Tax=Candidatus Pelagibacter sp. Uisw_127 TaxID=3230988 RepID=UPI0039E7F586
MLKRVTIIFIFFLTTSCGYEIMHSKKNTIDYNFSIKDITLTGDTYINLKIKQKLNSYILNQKNKVFDVKINSASNREILAKDVKGDATSFKNTIVIYVEVIQKDKIKNTLKLEKALKYDNKLNKFDLNRYERELKTSLADTMMDELIFKLSNIQ